MLSSTIPDQYIRSVIAFVIFASGLKYTGVGTTPLGSILVVVILAGAAFMLRQVRSADAQPKTNHPDSHQHEDHTSSNERNAASMSAAEPSARRPDQTRVPHTPRTRPSDAEVSLDRDRPHRRSYERIREHTPRRQTHGPGTLAALPDSSPGHLRRDPVTRRRPICCKDLSPSIRGQLTDFVIRRRG
jgi:hypothetical protein